MNRIEQIKELRVRTGCGLKEGKDTLEETNGNFDKAVLLILKRGQDRASTFTARSATEGLIYSYTHPGNRQSVTIVLTCETDFVAKNQQFSDLARDLCLHIISIRPSYISKEHIPTNYLESNRQGIFVTEQKKQNQRNSWDKEAQYLDFTEVLKTIEASEAQYIRTHCLLEQPFVKNSAKTVREVIQELSSLVREKIEIKEFKLFSL